MCVRARIHVYVCVRPSNMRAFVYCCVCDYACVCIIAHTTIRVCVCICMCACVCACMCTRVCDFACVRVVDYASITRACVYSHVCVLVCMSKYAGVRT